MPASVRRAQWLLFVIPALWSANYLVARLAKDVIHPHALAFGRWGLALLLMLPFVAGALWLHRRTLRQEAWHCLVLGGLGMWICGAWVYLGGRSTSATNMALIYATTPVAIAVASIKLLHERMRAPQRVAVLFALAGVLFVVAKGQVANLLTVQWTPGDGWIAGAALAWTAYSVLLKRWPSVLEPLPRLAVIVAGGLVVMLPFTVWEWAHEPALPLTGRAVLLVVVAAVVPGVLSYAAYSYLQRALGAARTALLLYLAPVYGSIGAWLVLGEVPGWYHAVGAALILPSIWLATRPSPNVQPNSPGARDASTPSSA